MQIVIIGTGNIATVLGRKLKTAKHEIVQVYGRTPAAATTLANELNASACSAWSDITQEAALYIIAVSDQALSNDEVQLRVKDQLVVHTAGAVTREVLKVISSNYGVLYPYQSVRKEITPMPEIPFLVDANTPSATENLRSLAQSISQNVDVAGDTERLQYHLCAVVANNFSNFLYALTEDYCRKNSLQFSNLLPLIDETANRLHNASPRDVQTGPALRKDSNTIAQHLQLLNHNPELKNLYQQFTEAIQAYRW